MKLVFVLILIVFFGYFFFGVFNFVSYGKVANNQDWYFHYGKARGESIDSEYWKEHPLPFNYNYLPLYHFVFSIFAVHQLVFYFANLVLVLVLIPALLRKLFDNDWSVAIYFGGCALSHTIIFGNVYPQALALLFFLGYLLNRKNGLAFFVFGLLASLTHSHGFYLFLAIGIVEALLLVKNRVLAVGIMTQAQMNDRNLILTLLSLTPLPIVFFGLREAMRKENLLYLGLIGISYAASVLELRTLCVAQLLLCGLAGKNIERTHDRIKKGFVLFLAWQAAFYVLEFMFGTWKFIVLN